MATVLRRSSGCGASDDGLRLISRRAAASTFATRPASKDRLLKHGRIRGVILAAGRGERMGLLGKRFPKTTLPVCNKPIIWHHIELMRAVGVEDVVVLIGHRGFEIAKLLGDGSQLGVKIHYVEQTESLGIAHAVGRLEPYLEGPFLLFLGDIFFSTRNLGDMVTRFEDQNGGAVLATKDEGDPDAIRRNFAIHLSPEGFVTRVIEKPRYTSNRLKGVGLYLFDLTIFDAIRRTPRTAMRDEYELTESIQVMIDDGLPVRVADVIDDDVNVTEPTDLLAVNLRQARLLGTGSLVGANCSIAKGATVEDSIIGANVTIVNPIRIRRSLVFDGARVDSEVPLEELVITPDLVIDCRREMATRNRRG
jgi:glucose-1-phosphate thymidylyltransferase